MTRHIFISYSRADRPDIKQLAEFLKDAGVPVWYDYELETGDQFWLKIQRKIDKSAAVLVAWSPNASKSRNVMREMTYADEQKKPLLPLVLKPSPVTILLSGLQQEVLGEDKRPQASLIQKLIYLIATDAIERVIVDYRDKTGAPVGSLRSASSHRTVNGYYQECDKGAIMWTPNGGAQPVWGQVAKCYARHNGPAGVGFALGPEVRAAESPQGTRGVYQRFEGRWEYPPKVIDQWQKLGQRGGASIYYSESFGAHPTYGGIGILYESLGGTWSEFGFPVSDEMDARTSAGQAWRCFQKFEGGAIFWCEEHHTVPVTGSIWEYLIRDETRLAELGHPIAPSGKLSPLPNVTIQVFERGMLTVRSGAPELWLKSMG